MQPGAGGDRERLGPCPNGQNAIGDGRRPRRYNGVDGTCPDRDRRPGRRERAASASASPPMPAQRSTTSGQTNRTALWRATGSEVACSTAVGSTHIRWPCSNLSAALARACDKRIAAETAAGEARFRSRARSAGRIDLTDGDLGQKPAASLGRQDPGLGVDGVWSPSAC